MAKSIMIQGTMSNAGKSLLVAALCRILAQDGLRVAPFKSQNMALNSYITANGSELSRATAFQAEAAGIEPDFRMNPILIKPSTDTTSTVIVNGQPWANMTAAEYFTPRQHETKKALLAEALAAYESLSADFDAIVLEGAGSPVEINLRDRDIVNMGFAREVSAPVLLAGDIDRGGVFAQLYGTVSLLEPEERALLKGLIVNKFRGDKSLFDDGVKMLEDICGLPVLGVIPYLDVDIEDEDSVSGRLQRSGGSADIDIAVVYMPRITNFTDLAALEATPGVAVRYLRRADDLGDADLLILPGTSNPVGDLRLLREHGWEQVILAAAGRDMPVLGIGGGYQMLGQSIVDADGTFVAGFGLLPVTTALGSQQRSARVDAQVASLSGLLGGLSGIGFSGYLISAGEVTSVGDVGGSTAGAAGAAGTPFAQMSDGALDGSVQGDVYGLSLHGLFDSTAVRQALLASLYGRKGLAAPTDLAAIDYFEYKQQQYDILADGVRASLDMELLYSILDG